MRGGFAQQRLAATGRPVEQESFGHRVIESLEQLGVEERHLDGIPDALHRFILPANILPEDRLDLGERPVQPFGRPDDLHRDALVWIQPKLKTGLELVLGEERRAADDQV